MSENGAEKKGPTDLQVVKGGQEIDVKYIDGSGETDGRIKVRLPNIRLLELYEDLQADEASLVELFVDKLDTEGLFKARRLFRERASLNELRIQTKTLKERQEIDSEISKIDVQLEALQKKDRWDDKITPESHDVIYEFGRKLWD